VQVPICQAFALIVGTPYLFPLTGGQEYCTLPIMARIARVVAPGFPHHVTQRGNRRQETFFSDKDYRAYLDLMAEWCGQHGVSVWAYCLMPNHVHMVVVPDSEDGLRRAIGEAHRRYTLHVNSRQGWRGHLWQGRFASVVLDEAHLLSAVRYVERNPVRAGLVTAAEKWPWSSASAHGSRRDDLLVKVAPMLERIGDWVGYLAAPEDEAVLEALRRHERTGRVLGAEPFIETLEATLARPLRPGKPGPRLRKNRD